MTPLVQTVTSHSSFQSNNQKLFKFGNYKIGTLSFGNSLATFGSWHHIFLGLEKEVGGVNVQVVNLEIWELVHDIINSSSFMSPRPR